ncbi:hypothetical protein T02_10594 [Trichinella nativa]|uniref:Uncharacterized protein n=2 Tax=Trichinella TaxID=6333 RepID=A0A0V1L2H7_9BILA|nr:hypothetical protein T05_7347 [Trichinella murrelli]KRZ53763.1 hypothetical protein T02_10594 [Trichinella nativa]
MVGLTVIFLKKQQHTFDRLIHLLRREVGKEKVKEKQKGNHALCFGKECGSITFMSLSPFETEFPNKPLKH